MKILIESTTAAVSRKLHISSDQFVSIAHDGLVGAEEITFEIDLAGTFTAVAPKVALTAGTNYIQIAGPNTYNVVKPTTASPVAVFVNA